MEKYIENIILGAGFAGLGAAHAFTEKGLKCTIIEKDNTFGGLCGNFVIDGFRFDRFVHVSFSKIDEVNKLFWESCGGDKGMIKHIPNPYNIYKKRWIKHPVQNNLYPLTEEEKKLVIDDFLSRPKMTEENKPENYEQWLRLQYGNYFAEHFSMVYTRKYWMKNACELRTEWTGARFYQPSVEEVIEGSKTSETPVTYYAKEQFYPKEGGFKTFVKKIAEESDIIYNSCVLAINPDNKTIIVHNDKCTINYKYKRLISSLLLPELLRMLDNVPDYVIDATNKLEATSGYHISIALKTQNIPPYMWWYVYDEDILSARVYSPSIKSPNNTPKGCSSLQMEVYCKEGKYSESELLDGTVGKLIELDIIKEEDILFTHVGFEKYGNIIFTKSIFEDRKVVRDYLSSVGIETIGRFGEWDYLWSDQSLASGLSIKIL